MTMTTTTMGDDVVFVNDDDSSNNHLHNETRQIDMHHVQSDLIQSW